MTNYHPWNVAMNIGSTTKPPTLVREEYPQWKIRMINFLNGIDRALYESICNGPNVPMMLIPAVPATEDTPAIPATSKPKLRRYWSADDIKAAEVDEKAKSLLIMALPNDIFQSVDSCESAKEIWDQLENLLEGGVKTKKSRRTKCLNEYESFKGQPDETLEIIYNRFVILINKLKRNSVVKTNEEKNIKFLKSLSKEWRMVSITLQTNQDLEEMSLHDLFGILHSQEADVLEESSGTKDPLALVSQKRRTTGTKAESSSKPLKSKVIASSDSEVEHCESEDELSSFAKSLALLTKQFQKYERKARSSEGKNSRYPDHHKSFRKDYKDGQKEGKEEGVDKSEVECFKCHKRGHFASECRTKTVKDADYYLRKYKSAKKKEQVLMAEQENWLSESSSSDDDQTAEAHICLMASGKTVSTSRSSDSSNEQVNISELDMLNSISELSSEFQSLKESFNVEKKRSERLEKEKEILHKEKEEILTEKCKLEKESADNRGKYNKLETAKINLEALVDFYENERKTLYRDLHQQSTKLSKYQDAQKMVDKVRNPKNNRYGVGYQSDIDDDSDKTGNNLYSIFVKESSQSTSLSKMSNISKDVSESSKANSEASETTQKVCETSEVNSEESSMSNPASKSTNVN